MSSRRQSLASVNSTGSGFRPASRSVNKSRVSSNNNNNISRPTTATNNTTSNNRNALLNPSATSLPNNNNTRRLSASYYNKSPFGNNQLSVLSHNKTTNNNNLHPSNVNNNNNMMMAMRSPLVMSGSISPFANFTFGDNNNNNHNNNNEGMILEGNNNNNKSSINNNNTNLSSSPTTQQVTSLLPVSGNNISHSLQQAAHASSPSSSPSHGTRRMTLYHPHSILAPQEQQKLQQQFVVPSATNLFSNFAKSVAAQRGVDVSTIHAFELEHSYHVKETATANATANNNNNKELMPWNKSTRNPPNVAFGSSIAKPQQPEKERDNNNNNNTTNKEKEKSVDATTALNNITSMVQPHLQPAHINNNSAVVLSPSQPTSLLANITNIGNNQNSMLPLQTPSSATTTLANNNNLNLNASSLAVNASSMVLPNTTNLAAPTAAATANTANPASSTAISAKALARRQKTERIRMLLGVWIRVAIINLAVFRFLRPVRRMRHDYAIRIRDDYAAFIIQCAWRRVLQRERLREYHALQVIARRFSMFLRFAFNRKRKAATAIQKVIRGFLARRAVKKVRYQFFVAALKRCVRRKLWRLRRHRGKDFRQMLIDERSLLLDEFIRGLHQLARSEFQAFFLLTTTHPAAINTRKSVMMRDRSVVSDAIMGKDYDGISAAYLFQQQQLKIAAFQQQQLQYQQVQQMLFLQAQQQLYQQQQQQQQQQEQENNNINNQRGGLPQIHSSQQHQSTPLSVVSKVTSDHHEEEDEEQQNFDEEQENETPDVTLNDNDDAGANGKSPTPQNSKIKNGKNKKFSKSKTIPYGQSPSSAMLNEVKTQHDQQHHQQQQHQHLFAAASGDYEMSGSLSPPASSSHFGIKYNNNNNDLYNNINNSSGSTTMNLNNNVNNNSHSRTLSNADDDQPQHHQQQDGIAVTFLEATLPSDARDHVKMFNQYQNNIAKANTTSHDTSSTISLTPENVISSGDGNENSINNHSNNYHNREKSPLDPSASPNLLSSPSGITPPGSMSADQMQQQGLFKMYGSLRSIPGSVGTGNGEIVLGNSNNPQQHQLQQFLLVGSPTGMSNDNNNSNNNEVTVGRNKSPNTSYVKHGTKLLRKNNLTGSIHDSPNSPTFSSQSDSSGKAINVNPSSSSNNNNHKSGTNNTESAKQISEIMKAQSSQLDVGDFISNALKGISWLTQKDKQEVEKKLLMSSSHPPSNSNNSHQQRSQSANTTIPANPSGVISMVSTDLTPHNSNINNMHKTASTLSIQQVSSSLASPTKSPGLGPSLSSLPPSSFLAASSLLAQGGFQFPGGVNSSFALNPSQNHNTLQQQQSGTFTVKKQISDLGISQPVTSNPDLNRNSLTPSSSGANQGNLSRQGDFLTTTPSFVSRSAVTSAAGPTPEASLGQQQNSNNNNINNGNTDDDGIEHIIRMAIISSAANSQQQQQQQQLPQQQLQLVTSNNSPASGGFSVKEHQQMSYLQQQHSLAAEYAAFTQQQQQQGSNNPFVPSSMSDQQQQQQQWKYESMRRQSMAFGEGGGSSNIGTSGALPALNFSTTSEVMLPMYNASDYNNINNNNLNSQQLMRRASSASTAMNNRGKYLYMFLQGGGADLAVTEPVLMAYGDLIERAEALTRKTLEQQQFQATSELHEQSRWGAALLREKAKIPPYFHSLLEKTYPDWSVKLASQIIQDELAGREQIMSLYAHLPLRPPWQQRTFGGMSNGMQFVLPHCSAGAPPIRIPLGEADGGFVENNGPAKDLSLLSGLVVRNLEGKPITLGRRSPTSTDGDDEDGDSDRSEDYDRYQHHHRHHHHHSHHRRHNHNNGENDSDDDGEYDDSDDGDDESATSETSEDNDEYKRRRKQNEKSKMNSKQQLLNQFRIAQGNMQQQNQNNIKIMGGSASLRLSQSARAGMGGRGAGGAGANSSRAAAATLEELEDLEHEQRTKRRKEARDVASARPQELGVLHLEDAEERRKRMMRSAMDSEESGLARKPTKPSSASNMNQSRRKKQRASVFSTLTQRIANVSESEMRDLQEGLHGASLMLEPSEAIALQQFQNPQHQPAPPRASNNNNNNNRQQRPGATATQQPTTFRRKVKLPDYKNENAPVSVLKSGGGGTNMVDDEFHDENSPDKNNQQRAAEKKKKRAVQFV